MSIFITSVDKHNQIKQEILSIANSVDITSPRPIAINVEHNKALEWYGDAIEKFRQHQLNNNSSELVFDVDVTWINVYPRGVSMNSHKHPDYYFYSVHYLQKTEEHPHTQMSDDNENWVNPEAVEGDIIFFSGETWHRVPENNTDTLRITVCMSASSVELKEQKLQELRVERNKLLVETDWWMMPDIPVSQERLDYRQALRDITKKYISLNNVVWPQKPE